MMIPPIGSICLLLLFYVTGTAVVGAEDRPGNPLDQLEYNVKHLDEYYKSSLAKLNDSTRVTIEEFVNILKEDSLRRLINTATFQQEMLPRALDKLAQVHGKPAGAAEQARKSLSSSCRQLEANFRQIADTIGASSRYPSHHDGRFVGLAPALDNEQLMGWLLRYNVCVYYTGLYEADSSFEPEDGGDDDDELDDQDDDDDDYLDSTSDELNDSEEVHEVDRFYDAKPYFG